MASIAHRGPASPLPVLSDLAEPPTLLTILPDPASHAGRNQPSGAAGHRSRGRELAVVGIER